jgi:hypothetical protein
MYNSHRSAPIIAAVLLLLPVLYMGSYLALALPGGRVVVPGGPQLLSVYASNYRADGQWPWRIFWPLEQIDRQLRPGEWEFVPDGVTVWE